MDYLLEIDEHSDDGQDTTRDREPQLRLPKLCI